MHKVQIQYRQMQNLLPAKSILPHTEVRTRVRSENAKSITASHWVGGSKHRRFELLPTTDRFTALGTGIVPETKPQKPRTAGR